MEEKKTEVTLEQRIYDTQKELVKIIEDSKLPAGVLELILRDLHLQLKNLSEQNITK